MQAQTLTVSSVEELLSRLDELAQAEAFEKALAVAPAGSPLRDAYVSAKLRTVVSGGVR